jgi:hypothetical protein
MGLSIFACLFGYHKWKVKRYQPRETVEQHFGCDKSGRLIIIETKSLNLSNIKWQERMCVRCGIYQWQG